MEQHAHESTAHVPTPTPASPLRVPEALAELDRELSAYDDAWVACQTDSERLALLNTRLRGLIERAYVGTRDALEAHRVTHAKMDAIVLRLDGMATRLESVDFLRSDVSDLRREVSELISVLKNTAGRQLATDAMAKDALEMAVDSHDRISHLDGEVVDLTTAVISLDAETRPQLDSVQDLAEQAITTSTEAYNQASQTTSDVKKLKAVRYILGTFGVGAVVTIYEVVKHVLLRALLGH